jgi:arylsulfatase A-like enzyme
MQSHDYTLDAMECDACMSQPTRPPKDAPDIVVIPLDDLGFAQFGCYGSDISKPAIDRLAAGGMRDNRFHVTALCSPTRAALLTCI